MADIEFRTCGYYATFEGVEYVADAVEQGEVVLRVFGDGPPPEGFRPAKQPGVALRRVPVESLENLVYVHTSCTWRGEGPFVVHAVVGSTLYLLYRGTRGGHLVDKLPVVRDEMGNFDTILDISEVENIHEEVSAR